MGTFIAGQALAIINGIFLIKSMRVTSKNKFLVFNTLANLFGCLSMVTLGAYAASIGPIVLTIQSFVTHKYEKKGKKQPKGLLALYLLLNLLGGVLTVNSALSILPVLSSSLACIMIMSKDMKTSRKINLVSSVLALPYLVINKAYVSALIFGSSFVNTIDAIYRLDYKKEQEEAESVEHYTDSHDSEKIADYLESFEYDETKKEDVQEKYKKLLEQDTSLDSETTGFETIQFGLEQPATLTRKRKKGTKRKRI